METGRLNVYIPKPELEAFRAWCKDKGISQSRALTGLIHTFNARNQKLSPKEDSRLVKNQDAASRHERYVKAKQKGQAMINALKKNPDWTTADLESTSSVEQSSAGFLDLE